MVKTYMKTPDNVQYGLSQLKRLQALEDATEEYTYPINITDGPSLTVKVCKIDIDILKYRITNNRTNKAQADWCRDNNKEVDNLKGTNWLRTQDPESEKIQKIQHELLNEMNIEQGTIYKTFLEDNQEDPVVVNSEGFVLSGNRRLAVFRNLFYNNKRTDLKYILVAFWEESTPDLDNLYEVQQDGRKQVDLDYDWFSFGQWLKKMRADNLSMEYIEKVSRREKADINKILRRYENAITFQVEQKELFGRDVSERKLMAMRQVFDNYHSFLKEIKNCTPARKKAVKRMITPAMLNWTGPGSSHLTVNYVKKNGPEKFLDEFYKIKEFKNDTEFEKYFDDLENWGNICETFGKINTKLTSKKIAKKKVHHGRDLIESAHMDIIEARAFFSSGQIGQNKKALLKTVDSIEENLKGLKKNIKENL